MTRAPALCLFLALCMAPVSAAEFMGILHNNWSERRASLETGRGIFLLDYEGADYLYRVGEHFDRQRVSIDGYSRPGGPERFIGVIDVNCITFKPYTRQETYCVDRRFRREYNTDYLDRDRDR